jgi:hypothetical protein
MKTNRSATLLAVPAGTIAGRCRSCESPIYWVKTALGRRMPVTIDETRPGHRMPTLALEGAGIAHFATCPNANDWRKPR